MGIFLIDIIWQDWRDLFDMIVLTWLIYRSMIRDDILIYVIDNVVQIRQCTVQIRNTFHTMSFQGDPTVLQRPEHVWAIL